jgi:hypothetical protein
VLSSAAVVFAAVLVFSPLAKAQNCAPSVNPIVCENSQPGNTGWDVSGSGDPTIQGFATDISVNIGGTIYFKVSTPASNYHIDIYRIGYYGGAGARKVASITPSVTLPQSQPACLSDPSTNLFDCGNWAISASWQVPTTAVSGLYAADLIRNDTGGASQMWFVVRNDTSTSDILVQTSDETWQAYNPYGGHSLYGDTGFNLPARAYKASYNRPFNTRTLEAATFLYNAEYPMIRWLEANGYDATYFTSVDAARSGSLIKNHKIYISSGHDEYWSAPHRASVEAARDAGVNLAFFSGNEMFWKTRWENSIDGTGTPYRTLVCYKETLDGSPSAGGGIPDPLDPPTWTGTWRDPSKSPPADGGRPENAVTGTLFVVNGPGSDNTNLSIQVPAADGKMRLWRNTSIATLPTGQVATLPAGTLGYEWDIDPDNGFRPAGTFDLATSTHTLTTDMLLDYGGIYGAGTATHHMTMHKAPSGALVFGAGTVQWAWGLDANHDGSGGGTDVRMQQATVNLLADMGVQPGTLQSGLVAASKSTDFNAPASTISFPTSGSTQQLGVPVTISGTAVDFGSGVVGGVEVSTDGGVTWHPASGRESWTYTWMPVTSGTINLLSRAVDDSGNLETPSAGVTVTVPKPAVSTDVNVSKDGGTASTTITSPTFSTGSANELLLAFISTDYLTGPNTTVTGVTGGGLTWVLAVRTNNQSGTSEIWRAFAPSQMSNISVAATLSQSVISSITVMTLTGVDTSGTSGSGAIGAKASGSAASGAPTATLVTTRNGSLIFAVGNDYDGATPRTPASGQSLVHQTLTAAGDTYWVQTLNTPVPMSGATVTVSDTAPTSDRYNLSAVEVLPTTGSTQQFSISGTVSPIPAGTGVTLTLSGATIGTATSDSSGNYTFTGLANGSYTVTPNKPGYGFTPPGQAVTVSGSNVSNVSFTASALPTYSVSGSISPLPGGSGVTLTLSAQSEGGTGGGTVTSDTSGNFTFSGVVNGTYTITPTKTGFSFNPASQTVVVNSAAITGVMFVAQTAPTAIKLVQANGAGNESAGSSISATFASSNTAGNLLVVTGTAATPNSTLTISDTAGNTYVQAMGPVNDPNQSVNAHIWYVPNCKGGPNTVKITPAAAAALEIHISEYSGVSTTAPLDQTSFATGNGTASSSGSKTTIGNGELIFGYEFIAPTTSTVGTGFTGVSFVNGDWDEYEIQASAGNVAATFTQPSGVWLAMMATFLPVGGFQASISGTISPATAGSGAIVTLSGAANLTTTADASGNYSFTGLSNGSYTVTPTKTGYTFTPTNRSVAINNGNAIGLNFTGAAQGPVTLSSTPSYVFFSAIPGGGNPAPTTVQISSSAGSTAISATSDSTWLSATPSTGTTPQQLQLSAVSTGLNIGTYTGHVTVSASGATSAIVTVVLNVGVTSDWLMIDHDPSRSGNAFDETTITKSTVGNLQLSWSATVDGSVTAQPLFVHGITIAGQTRDVLVVATGGNSIYALDASTGQTLWTRNFGAPTPNTWGLPDGFGIEGPPVIDRALSRIYTVSTDGSFRAISLLDGTDMFAALPIITNPVTNKIWGGLNKVGNSIYFATASNGGDVAPWRGQVYQIDVSATPKLTGNFVVVPSIPAPNGGGGIWGYGGVSADLISGNIYAASAQDSVVVNGNEGSTPYSDSMIALNSNLGLLGYYQAPQPPTFPCGGTPCDLDFASTPAVFQPAGCPVMLAAGNKNGNLYLFRASDLAASGQPLQVLTLNNPYDDLGLGGIAGVPTFSPANNMLYITDAGPGITGIAAGLVAMSVTSSCTLQVAWSKQLNYASETPQSTPTIANGVVFLGEGATGIIHAYDAQSGVQLWQSGTNYKAAATFAAPIVAGGRLFAGSWSSFSGGGIVGAFTLPATTPILAVSPTTVTFNATAGGTNPAPASVNITNSGVGSLSFTASSDSNWLTASPTSGTAPQSVQISAAVNGLAAGTYTGHITITAAGAQGSPTTVLVTFTVSPAGGTGVLASDQTAFADNGSSSSSITVSNVSTNGPNELLLAMVATDALSPNMTVTSITGAGLTWALVLRTNTQSGTSEIWRAFASSPINAASVTANLSQSMDASMIVMSFSGVDTSGSNGSGAIGATKSVNAASGAPTASLTTTRNNSWVMGVGNDYDQAVARTVGANQTLIHQYLSPSGDTYWMQRQNASTPVSGTSVTINDTAPTTDRYNFSIVEILPALNSGPTFTISGTVSPSAAGSGTTLTLSGAGTGTTTGDASGNYTFSSLANGTYTVTPSRSGYTFSPVNQTVTVNGTNITGVNFTATVNPTYTISGAVSPVSAGNGTTLTLSGARTGTATGDASGNYSFANLANGTYTVTPSRSGYTFSPASQTVTVNGANITGVNFAATPNPTYTISGTVSPVSAGSGTTLALSGAATGTATGDASGNYSFTNLANGTYTVTPSRAGYTFTPASQTITVNGSNVTGVNFSATVAATGTISGNVSPASAGNGTTLTLSGAGTGSTTGDGSGNYSFAALTNGTYTITPSRSGYSFTPSSQTVTVSGANVSGVNFTATPVLARDVTVSADASSASTTIKSPAFSTTAGNELLLAFVTGDYISGTNTTVTGITGGGLTWVLVARANTQRGNSEIWRAFAASPLSNATVTATLSQSVISSITIMSFSGVATSGTNGSGAIGATKTANGSSGAPTASLVTTQNNSWVIGVGNDYDNATARTLGSGQTLIHQYLTPAGDTYWVQMRSITTPASGTTVTINDTAPTNDRWNLAICEILP